MAFYKDTFGIAASELPQMPYFIFGEGEQMSHGLMLMDENFPPGVPPHWFVYFAVADADVALARVVELGGEQVAPPFDTEWGRFVVVKNPTGASFGLMQPPVAG